MSKIDDGRWSPTIKIWDPVISRVSIPMMRGALLVGEVEGVSDIW